MKRLYATFFFSMFLTGAVVAQEEVYSSSGKPLNRTQKNVKDDRLIDPSRIIVGGWGLFGIGSGVSGVDAGVTNVGITPILGYRITDGFSAGIGFGYQYLRVKDYFLVYTSTSTSENHPLNAHFYSPNIWARYIIWNNIFAQAEYEHNISSYKEYTNDFTQFPPPVITRQRTINVACLLIGGGVRIPISHTVSIVPAVLYDVLQNYDSPYRNTIATKIGVNIGF